VWPAHKIDSLLKHSAENGSALNDYYGRGQPLSDRRKFKRHRDLGVSIDASFFLTTPRSPIKIEVWGQCNAFRAPSFGHRSPSISDHFPKGFSGMILQIALVLLIFFFFFLTYMVSKSWRAFHVVCLVAVFFSAIAFMFFAAFTLKTQSAWRTIVNDLEQRAEDKTQEAYDLRYGPDNDTQGAVSSLKSAQAELELAVLDRGRVWRDCIPQDVNYDQAANLLRVTLSIPPRELPPPAAPAAAAEDPAQPAPAAAPAAIRHLMEQKVILFAFLELPADPDDPTSFKVPAYYLGEYFATAVTPTNVTLQSVVPPGSIEIQAAQSGGGTWALYEVMPTDGHRYFAVDEQTIRGYLSPERTGLTQGLITQEQYDEMIQEYLRDQKPAAEDDPPERKWALVEFKRNYDVTVDAARPDLLTTENFDSQGKAKNVQLQQGDKTTFEIGDTVEMDYVSASDLAAQGVVEIKEEFYVRELRDYEYSFHNIYRRIVELQDNLRNTQRDRAKADETIAKMREQIAYREQEKAKLNEDLSHLTDERQKLEAYLGELTTFRGQLSARLSSLYQHSNALETQLSEMQAGLEEEIDDRTRRAVAEVGTGAPTP
jgi:hypothetical protein